MKLNIDEFENYAKRNGVSPRLMLQKLGGGRLAYKHLKNGCALGYELAKDMFVYLMGAEAAFEVLYFPSNRKRKKVWWEVFGKYKGKEEL